MRVGLITGSGGYDWPGLVAGRARRLRTSYGEVEVTEGAVGGVEVVHLSRHGMGHARLSNHVEHRANVQAMVDADVAVLVSLTVCGAVDRAVELGSLVVFDDLYFPSNRLPDGSLCTWHTEPGERGRGHWIADRPFSDPVRQALYDAAHATGSPVTGHGCYGHVDGPRFNTRTEIAALAAVGATAVSQTAGPEVVLAGEAELPMALLGYVTDYANGVADAPEPVDALLTRMQASRQVFATVVGAALSQLSTWTSTPAPVGVVHRFGP